MNLRLDTSVQYVPRIGPQMAKRLEKLEIRTVRDLLFYAPFRYNDYSLTVPINRIVPGTSVTVEGNVQSIKNIFTKTGKKLQEAVVGDQYGLLTVVWFNQIYLPKVIHPGDRIALSGTIGFFGNKIVMESPTYEIIGGNGQELLHTGRFVPVYSETAGVSSKWLRSRIAFLLSVKHTFLNEVIPRTITQKYGYMDLSEALSCVHFPKSLSEAEEARKRLAFDELFFLQLTSTMRRKQWEEVNRAPVFIVNDEDIKLFTKSLPFQLTDDQQGAIRQICTDVKRKFPMNRLLEGDVGSGKTVVAAFAMYLAAKNGYSSLLMAPTQILAQQHFLTIRQLLEPFGITVQLILGGKKKTAEEKKSVKKTSHDDASIQVTIGTHALLEENVKITHVGLVVIDEQQRFGVAQRSIIRKKGVRDKTPHFFTMTATPIPRTLALTVYGNLDLSVLTEMPKGRTPVKTWVVPQEKRQAAYEWMRKELKSHDARAFLVCPFIEESESMSSIKAAKKEFEHIQSNIFPDISVGLMHGKLKAKEKTQTLDEFRSGKTKILVTTPVVEVGIDIKEASIMLIEGSERFGLAQLHQLRGRVGRGDLMSYCLLFTENTDQRVFERLKILEKVRNGPELSEYDLNLRGEGDILGFRQHGLPPLTLASLKDTELVAKAQESAHAILDEDPKLQNFPLLREYAEKGTIEKGIQD